LVFLNQLGRLTSAFVHQALLPRPIHSNLPGLENYFAVAGHTGGRVLRYVRSNR